MAKIKDYPDRSNASKKEWLRDVRKRWTKFRSDINVNYNSVRIGCAYYPDEVYKWIDKFNEMDKLMKDYYKNA